MLETCDKVTSVIASTGWLVCTVVGVEGGLWQYIAHVSVYRCTSLQVQLLEIGSLSFLTSVMIKRFSVSGGCS